jgi:hypothetical protein
MTHPLPIETASAGSPCPGQHSVQGSVVLVRIALNLTIVASCGTSGSRPTEIGRSSYLPRRGLSSLKIFEGNGEIIPEQAYVEPAPLTAEPRQIPPGEAHNDAILVLERATSL